MKAGHIDNLNIRDQRLLSAQRAADFEACAVRPQPSGQRFGGNAGLFRREFAH
jgi:hypothetical protein